MPKKTPETYIKWDLLVNGSPKNSTSNPYIEAITISSMPQHYPHHLSGMIVQDNVGGEKINNLSVMTYKILPNYICPFPYIYAKPRLTISSLP